MPIYEFRCERCGRIREVIVLGGTCQPPTCEQCGIAMKRIMSPFAYNPDRTSERESRVMKLASDYLKDGKVKDAARFLKKAEEHLKTDTIKRASEALNKAVSDK